MSIDWAPILQVLIVSLVGGVGLVGSYTAGLWAWSRHKTAIQAGRRGTLAGAAAVACFVVFGAVIAYGLYRFVAG
jgi:ABC-type sulfate transport system permease component